MSRRVLSLVSGGSRRCPGVTATPRTQKQQASATAYAAVSGGSGEARGVNRLREENAGSGGVFLARGLPLPPDPPAPPDKASNCAVLRCQGGSFLPLTPLTGPRWPDLEALWAAYGEARGVEAKREMVASWAAAAGGRVEDGTLRLPGCLPKGTAAAAAFLKIYARCVGLTVGELTCAWCANPPLRGDTLCDACRWVAGEKR